MSNPIQQPFRKILNRLDRIIQKQDTLESKINKINKRINVGNSYITFYMENISYHDDHIKWETFACDNWPTFMTGIGTGNDIVINFVYGGKAEKKTIKGDKDIEYLLSVNYNSSNIVDYVMIRYGWIPGGINKAAPFNIGFDAYYKDQFGISCKCHFTTRSYDGTTNGTVSIPQNILDTF